MAVDAVVQMPAKRLFKSGARRCLFGVPDHDATMKFLQEANRKLDEAANKKWNFDFKSESPLPGGTYVWEKMTPATCNTPRKNKRARTLTPGSMPVRKFRVLNSKEPCGPVGRSLKAYVDCKRARWCPTPEASGSVTVHSDVENADALMSRLATVPSSTTSTTSSTQTSFATRVQHTSTGAENDEPSTQTVISSSSSVSSRKRKQSRISEFFPQKKSRTDVLRVKRRLDL